VQYLGIDWGTRRAAWCALTRAGELQEGMIAADDDGLLRLVARLGPDVYGCIEMMSGAAWVRDRLAACGWTIEVAEAREVKAIAPLACKTDRVDARVLAELARRDLVPDVWVPSLDDRAIRERLRRRSHLVRLRTSSMNRTFGLLTQWGLRRKLTALRQPGTLEELAEQGVPEVWRHSIATLLAVIDDLDRQLAPLERELRPLARSDGRATLLMTIPGVAELLGLTIASEIGDISRFPSARKLVGYSGLTPRIKQSGQSERVGRLSKAGPDTLRWAAVEAALAAHQPLARALHRHQGALRQVEPGQGRGRPQGPDRLLACARSPRAPQAERIPRHRSCPGKLLHSSGRLKAHKRSEKPGQLQPDHLRPQRRKRSQHPLPNPKRGPATELAKALTSPPSFKETSGSSADATSPRNP
jgi:transposase